jgi:molybdopterin converting factor small subunit
MEIQVRLHGALSRYRPADGIATGAFHLDVAEGATIATVIDQLGIPASWVRGRFVNERPCEPRQPLSSGDQLVLFPPVGGGGLDPERAWDRSDGLLAQDPGAERG